MPFLHIVVLLLPLFFTSTRFTGLCFTSPRFYKSSFYMSSVYESSQCFTNPLQFSLYIGWNWSAYVTVLTDTEWRGRLIVHLILDLRNASKGKAKVQVPTSEYPATHALLKSTRELKQPRRRRRQKPHEFAYLTIKNSIFARFARSFFIF